MQKSRLEAFSDGVLAIIITIMVLELKVPHGTEWKDLLPLAPIFFSYTLSFVYIAIYWNNHHHMLHAVKSVNGPVLWANLHLLFWLSLIPFVTTWIGENEVSTLPTAAYGAVLLMAGLAYFILVHLLIALNGRDSLLAKAVGSDIKGRISVVICALAIVLAWFMPLASIGLYVAVALMWLVPDKRIESHFKS